MKDILHFIQDLHPSILRFVMGWDTVQCRVTANMDRRALWSPSWIEEIHKKFSCRGSLAKILGDQVSWGNTWNLGPSQQSCQQEEAG